MLIVAGISLKNLQPRVWDSDSPYFLPDLRAVMVSYADFAKRLAQRRKAMDLGLRAFLGVPPHIQIYLDNGAFYYLDREGETPRAEYEEFVARAQPDWWPIPQDFIPTATMPPARQRACFERTMAVNRAYEHDGYTPVIHISSFLSEYVVAVKAHERLAAKPGIALGGIVPNLLRAPKAIPYAAVLESVMHVRREFADKRVHVYGIGGTATLHLAALLGIDSVDSSGWRNRAARGIVQLPGCGDRMIADLGSWRGRRPDAAEVKRLRQCECPACQRDGLAALHAKGTVGFAHRATHNLWTLLREEVEIAQHLGDGTYTPWYRDHLDNTIYRPLIDQLVVQAAAPVDPDPVSRPPEGQSRRRATPKSPVLPDSLCADGLMIAVTRAAPAAPKELAMSDPDRGGASGAAQSGAILFYSTKDPYGAFSNFAAYPIVMRGVEWRTNEHYFQAQKFAGTAHEEAIRRVASPAVAARMGRSRQRPLRPDWEAVKDDIMLEAIRAKFAQHPALARLLLTTGNTPIVEHTTRDHYWGDGGNGSGKNMLGRLLMRVRAELRAGVAH